MSFEIALLERSEEPGADGVRLVGRTRDRELIAAVRKHLLARLQDPSEPEEFPAVEIEGARGRREH